MEHLGTSVHDAELGRVTQVTLGDDRRRVTEHRRGVRVGLLVGLEAEPVVERLRTVVEPAAARTVGLGDRIDRRQGLVVLVEDAVLLVADLVQDLDVLAERRGVGRPDDGLPARLDRRGSVLGRQPQRVRRLDRQHAEQTMVDRRPMTGARADVVRALQGPVVGNVVAVQRCLTGGNLAAEVPSDLVARPVVRQTVDVQAIGAAGRAVGHIDLDAITFVGADHQRLDRIITQTQRHLAGLLLGTDRRDLTRQRIHLARRVVIAPAVQRDVDIDHRHVVRASERSRRAHTRRRDSAGLRRRDGHDADSEQCSQRQRDPLAPRQRTTRRPRDRGQAQGHGGDQQRRRQVDEELGEHRHRQRRHGTVVGGVAEDSGMHRHTECQRRSHRRGNGARSAHRTTTTADKHHRRDHGEQHQWDRQRRVAQPVRPERDARLPGAAAPMHGMGPQPDSVCGQSRNDDRASVQPRITRVARPAIHDFLVPLVVVVRCQWSPTPPLTPGIANFRRSQPCVWSSFGASVHPPLTGSGRPVPLCTVHPTAPRSIRIACLVAGSTNRTLNGRASAVVT